MEDSLFTYGSKNKLKDAAYTCMGYSFIGWAEKADAAKPDYPRLEDGTFEETFADYIRRKDDTDTVLHHGDNLILYAVWKMMDYTITFDSGRCPEPSYKEKPLTVSWNVSKAGDTIPEVEYTWDGYTLDGWTLDPTSTKAMFHGGDLLYAVTSAVPSEYAPRVYAVWKPVDYTVKRISDGTELDPIIWNLDSPADAKVGAPTREGYTFLGWAKEDGGAAVYQAETPLKDIVVQDGVRDNRTLYALWTPNTYEGENDGLDSVTIQAPAKAPALVPPSTPTPDQPEPEDPPAPDPVTPPDETGDEEETGGPKGTEEPKETEETGDA